MKSGQMIRNLPLKIIFLFVRGYQYLISPMLGVNCRFMPSCSEYCIQSCQTHGVIKGLYYTSKRLLKCHPWGGSGEDLVKKK